jgi:hypothetical protein
MLNAIWAYPWDVLDLGIERCVMDIAGRAGLDGISLACADSAGRFFQARSPLRKIYCPENGVIYFRPHSDRFGRLAMRPKMAEIVNERGDVLNALLHAGQRAGLAVNARVACLHNARLGRLHPHACCRNAFGDVAEDHLCPSQPDARAYAVALVAELTAGYAVAAVELEGMNFAGTLDANRHVTDGIGLTPEDDLLLSVCFCPACLARAAGAGVDGEAARVTVRRLVEESAARALPAPRWPDLPVRGPDAFAEYSALHDYLLWRCEPVTSLVEEVRAAANPAVPVRFIAARDGWRFGDDLAAIARVCDGIVLCAYDAAAAQVWRDVDGAMKAAGGKPVFVGLRLFFPELDGAGKLAGKVAAASEAGVAGFVFCDYGLVPAARLDWVRAALERSGVARPAA